MWIAVAETTVGRHLDKFYFGKSRRLERNLMTLVALLRCVVLFDWFISMVNHFMASEAFNLFFSAVRYMQLLCAVLILISEVMTIQATDVLHLNFWIYLLVVTHLFAIELSQNKFSMVNLCYALFDWFSGCIVTIPAFGFNQMNFTVGVDFREMTDETNLSAYLEMFCALEMAVARGTKQRQSAYSRTYMSIMTEFILIIDKDYRLRR
jgi:hypothetical protein